MGEQINNENVERAVISCEYDMTFSIPVKLLNVNIDMNLLRVKFNILNLTLEKIKLIRTIDLKNVI